MKEDTAKLAAKANRTIEAGQSALDGGHLETAAGRAYYAMFYIAEALLNERGLQFRRHGGVHGAFGEHLVKTGLIHRKYHRWLLAAFNKRIVADYGVEVDLMHSEVEQMLSQAREFLTMGREFLEHKT